MGICRMTVETTRFTGFRPEAWDFLADLAQNNDRAWFNPRKADYERLLKGPMEALVAALADRFDARGIPLRADPRRSIFRIYRDTRFSKDKSPYKTHLGANFPWIDRGSHHDATDDAGAHSNGGYLHIQPGNDYVGGGLWRAEKPRLDAFRRAIVEDPDRVRAVLEEPGFVAAFGAVESHETFKRVPPGWPLDHPMADLFRFKDIVFGRRLTDDEARSPDLPDILAESYAAAMPVFRFLATLRD
jgi:uncharacterized protein (TIGR02453 family)